MSYSPPLGNAVNFTATGIAYTPSAGDSVDFVPSPSLFVSGVLPIGGSASILSLGTWDLSVADSVQFGGALLVETSVGQRININSKFALTGEATIIAAAALDVAGALKLSGQAFIHRASALNVAGKVTFRGHVSMGMGRRTIIDNKMHLSGQAQFRAGERLVVSTGITFYGRAQFIHAPKASISVASKLSLRGRMKLRHTQPCGCC